MTFFRMPPIYPRADGAVSFPAHQPLPETSLAQLKQDAGYEPDPADWDTIVHPVVVNPVGPAAGLTRVDITVPFVSGDAALLTLTTMIGDVPLYPDPFAEAERLLLRVAEASDFAPDDLPLITCTVTWADGLAYRAPIPVFPLEDGTWDTPGITETIIRYSLYFASQEDYTQWDPLGVDWGRILNEVPPEARNLADRMLRGDHQLVGGLAWSATNWTSAGDVDEEDLDEEVIEWVGDDKE